jgi:uncharacterized membrane protein YdbT with pleckstrin-like domain
MMKKGEENELLKLERYVFSTSRRAFFMIYLLVVGLLLFLVVIAVRKIPTPEYFFWIVLFCCLMLIKTSELYRYRKNCEINKSAVVVNVGIINVKSERVDHVAISEVIVSQTLLQKFLNIGDIKIVPLTHEKTNINLTDSPEPKKIAELIEYRMANAKRARSS